MSNEKKDRYIGKIKKEGSLGGFIGCDSLEAMVGKDGRLIIKMEGYARLKNER